MNKNINYYLIESDEDSRILSGRTSREALQKYLGKDIEFDKLSSKNSHLTKPFYKVLKVAYGGGVMLYLSNVKAVCYQVV